METNMTKEKALDILERHNLWRRGADYVEATDPRLLGMAIDKAIEVLRSSNVCGSLPSTEEIEKEARARFKGRNHTKWKAGMFKAGANWMKSIAYGCSDVIGNKEFVGNER